MEKVLAPEIASGKVEVRNDGPFEKNPHYVRLTSAGHRDLWTGIQNEGCNDRRFDSERT